MKVSISQIYIRPGVNFPFSHLMQRWLTKELSSLADNSIEFEKRYGTGFDLVLNVSADTGIIENLIKGPTIFKKSRDVEYTVFLPYDVIVRAPEGLRVALEFLLSGIRCVFHQTGIEPKKLDEKRTAIINHICSDATMLEEPWPDH